MSRICFKVLLFFLFVLIGGSHHVAADTCSTSKIPTAGDSNVWHCLNDSDTVFIFVHGLHSDVSSAWVRPAKDAGSTNVFWPNLVLADPNLVRPSVFLAGFYTELGGTTYSMSDAAAELYTKLSVPSGDQPAPLARKNIVFVAHSLGGILVRALMVRWPQAFNGKRVGLLLVASPSMGSQYARMLATVANVTRQRLVQELDVSSPFLTRLDDDFRLVLTERKIAGLVGSELIENQFVDLGERTPSSLAVAARAFGYVMSRVYGKRIVEPESAARYFPKPVVIPKSDHTTIAQPLGFNDYAHRELVALHSRMQALERPSCSAPPGFRIVIDAGQTASNEAVPKNLSREVKDSLPRLLFLRLAPDGTFLPGVSDEARRDPNTKRHVFTPSGPFPCAGEAYEAKYRRIPITSHQEVRQASYGSLCFRRSQVRATDQSAFLRCAGGTCSPDTVAPGLADPCGRLGFSWPTLVPKAHAQDIAQHWAVPSLPTLLRLPDADRPGYAEFEVESGPIAGAEAATHFSYAITVNGMPLHVDGLPPHIDREPFNGTDGVRLIFGIENLGFTGGVDGFENIQIELKFWEGTRLLRQVQLKRFYVSYRHAQPVNLKTEAGHFVWRGRYRPAALLNRYEIIVGVSRSLKGIADMRADLDGWNLSYDGSKIAGVIRPGRADNPVLGLTIGLRQSTGQVSSTFTEEEAKRVCQWINTERKFPKWMREAAYLYEFPAENFTETTDRGRQRSHCKNVRL